jgi:hypothetical protein
VTYSFPQKAILKKLFKAKSMGSKKQHACRVLEAKACCNPSYLGGRDQENQFEASLGK